MSAAEQCQFIACLYSQVTGQYSADENLSGVDIGEIMPLFDETRQAGNVNLKIRFDADQLQTIGAFFTGGYGKGDAACSNLIVVEVLANSIGRWPV